MSYSCYASIIFIDSTNACMLVFVYRFLLHSCISRDSYKFLFTSWHFKSFGSCNTEKNLCVPMFQVCIYPDLSMMYVNELHYMFKMAVTVKQHKAKFVEDRFF